MVKRKLMFAAENPYSCPRVINKLDIASGPSIFGVLKRTTPPLFNEEYIVSTIYNSAYFGICSIT